MAESVLTCASLQQAQDVVDRLLSKGMINGAEILPNLKNVKIIFTNLTDEVRTEITDLLGSDADVQTV